MLCEQKGEINFDPDNPKLQIGRIFELTLWRQIFQKESVGKLLNRGSTTTKAWRKESE